MRRPIFKMAVFALIITFAGFAPGHAAGVNKIGWEDLTPKFKPLKNPLHTLTDDQRVEFENLEYWLSLDTNVMDKEALVERKEAKKAALKSKKILTRQGVKVDALYERYGDWLDEVDRRSASTVKKYDGKQVSLPGYLLPLDFSDKGVKEFLLVPYVGACIHVPPPPTNQIAFIRMNKPHKVKGLYDPVWVTGRMSNKAVSKNLSLVDGSSIIHAGYTLTGEKITKYKPPK